MEFKFIKPKDPEYVQERMLRAKVLREPHDLPPGSEVFPFEKEAYHLVAIKNDEVIGCVMFNPEGETGRLLQMAIFEKHQKKGVGTKLIKKLEKQLKKDGIKSIYLHARDVAVPFYERLGFEVYGDDFLEVGIKHFNMRKEL